MEDSPEDLPKPVRHTAARPFFSPRPNSGEGVTGPLELSRRRAAQLFTPPGSSPATPIADKSRNSDAQAAQEPADIPSVSAADGSIEMATDGSIEMAADGSVEMGTHASEAEDDTDVDFEGDWTPAPMIAPERTLDAESLLASGEVDDDDRLVVEQYEHAEIELTASASTEPDEHSIEVIAYDDANSFLQSTATEGENPLIDGLRLESTEFSFEQAPAPPRLNVDSFWATAPFSAVEASAPAAEEASVADETEATIDEATAGDAEDELMIENAGTEPTLDDQPLEWADDPSTTIAHAQAAAEPEPEHDPEPARAPEPRLADIAPPWMSRLTPVNSRALEELKESEPWDLTPAHGLEQIHEEEDFAPTPAVVAIPETQAPIAAASVGNDVAEALERIAARVRDGGIDVPAGSDLSDEAALSAVLTALLRSRR
jgi:hypothetical protein